MGGTVPLILTLDEKTMVYEDLPVADIFGGLPAIAPKPKRNRTKKKGTNGTSP